MGLIDRLVAIVRRENEDLHIEMPAPGMNRRRFLALMGASAGVAAAAPLVDLEALVWTPGQQIAVPRYGAMMLTPQFMTNEALRFIQQLQRQYNYLHSAIIEQVEIKQVEFGPKSVWIGAPDPTMTEREWKAQHPTFDFVEDTSGIPGGRKSSVSLATGEDVSVYGVVQAHPQTGALGMLLHARPKC